MSTTLISFVAVNMSISEAQKLLLLSSMEQSPELCNNRTFMQGETKQQRKAKWDAIAASLNAVGGTQKDSTGGSSSGKAGGTAYAKMCAIIFPTSEALVEEQALQQMSQQSQGKKETPGW